MTLFMDALKAAERVLRADPSIADEIYRNRGIAIPEGVMTAVNLTMPDASADAGVSQGGVVIWRSLLRVECYSRAGPGQVADEVADVLTKAVYDRLMADPTFGGAVGGLEPIRGQFDFQLEGRMTGCVAIDFSVRHACRAASL